MKLSAEARQRIHAAVADAETRTGAHLAVTIVPASDRYALYPLLWGAMTAFVVGAVLALARPELSLRMGVILEAAGFAAIAFVLEPFALRLLAVPKAVKRDKARALAHREFAARILGSRRDGILIFASLGERHVELIATKAVHDKVGEAAWNTVVAEFSATAASGRVADAAIDAIKACERQLLATQR